MKLIRMALENFNHGQRRSDMNEYRIQYSCLELSDKYSELLVCNRLQKKDKPDGAKEEGGQYE